MIKAADFNLRADLEVFVVGKYGRTTNTKDDVITGTEIDLKKLQLSHGQSVWGVPAEAIDFKPEKKFTRPNRGKLFDSKLNGKTVIKNAKTNKNRAKRRGT